MFLKVFSLVLEIKWSICLTPFKFVSTEGKFYPSNLMEGDSAEYSACIMENASVVLVLKVRFGGTDGDQRNEDNLKRVSPLTCNKVESAPGLSWARGRE